jgi:DNA polymerase elongation subunit (family B)
MSDNKEIKFQIIDWRTTHEEDEDHEPEKGQKRRKNFVIKLYGRTDNNQTILVKVLNFTPYFYVKLPALYRKEQIQLIIDEVYQRVFPTENQQGLYKYEVEQRYDFYGFTDYTKFTFLKLVFTNYDSMRSYTNVFKKSIRVQKLSKYPIKFQLYESNIEPFIRFMHIRELEAVGWCSIPENKYQDIGNISCNDINISVNWTDIYPVNERKIMPLVIASFDIECNSEDGSFPQAERELDKIIQIGTTFSRFGEAECFRQCIITLGTCDPLEGIEIIRCKTEKDVLLEWTKLIRESNPDIITGYNIFGFDFSYMQKRAKKLGIASRFEKLSRDHNEDTPFLEKKLASSALGENIFKFYDMTGRVMIDLMKVIQRDHKLESYKLDYVASWFIREEIQKIEIQENKTLIHTKNTYGVKPEQFITVFYNDGLTDNKHMDGKKFKILELWKDKILVEGIIEDDIFKIKSNKIFWCNAKDDISPQEIFKCQRGTSKDRSIIAKYCIMDCALCNKLMNKLQVITNNSGMANVCHVPLSYLFMRGQGVKIYSLVSKKCRNVKHLIPTLIKKKKEDNSNKVDKKEAKIIEKRINDINNKNKDLDEVDDEEDEGYEGATVFTPESGVHYDPIPVLDYASLYPNSMILRNLSHEMKVTEFQYDDLYDRYRYHTITYKNGDGSFTTCKFAEKKDGTKGIIPEILAELLAARKKYKKLMDDEKDSFVKSILDGLQQAYKVTANSLYGQTGAPTSPIYMKEIAASTTATGREMLQFSKYFIENIYLKLIYYAQEDKNKYLKYMNEIFEYHIHKIDFYDDTKKDLDLENHQKMQNAIDTYLEGKENNNEDSNFTIVTVCTDEKKEIPSKKFNGVLSFIRGKEEEEIKYENKEQFFEVIYEKINENLKNYDINMNVIYGDSVVGDTPVLIKMNKKINIMPIKDLGNKWTPYDAFKKDDKSLSDKLQDTSIKCEVWTDKGWTKVKRVIKHKTTKNIYEVLTDTGYIKVTEDHSLLLKNGESISPKDVDYKTELLHYGLPDIKMTYSSDKTVYTCETHKQITAMYLYYELRKMGYYVKIELNKGSNFILKYSSSQLSANPNIIKHIKNLGPYDNYVYDLETENHHFHAGVGELIVHNTDSVFFKTTVIDKITKEKIRDKRVLPVAINIGIMASGLINIALPDNMKQEYEKVLWPFAILTKKRYVGNLYEKNPEKYKQKSMGIVLKRRDNAPIVKVVVGGIIDQILNKRSPQGAVEFTRKSLKMIFNNKFPIDKYIITKTLKDLSSYKDPSSIVHAVLAEIMAERDPGNKPQANDRIPFVYKVINEKKVLLDKHKKYIKKKNLINGACECDQGKCECYIKMCKRKKCVNNKKCTCHTEILQGDRVEHPVYLLENNLSIDYLFYITNQIMKPAIQFLELIIESPEKIFEEYIIREENKRSNKVPIEYFFKQAEKTKEDNNNLVIDLSESTFTDKVKKKLITVKGNRKSKTPKKKNSPNNFVEEEDGIHIM